jgi:hypothetical protein
MTLLEYYILCITHPRYVYARKIFHLLATFLKCNANVKRVLILFLNANDVIVTSKDIPLLSMINHYKTATFSIVSLLAFGILFFCTFISYYIYIICKTIFESCDLLISIIITKRIEFIIVLNSVVDI